MSAYPENEKSRRMRPAVMASVKAHLDTRPARVTLLAVAMTLMGLADLQLTLTYMRSIGMIELNPIAREMVEIGGSRQLIVFKLFTIAASAGLLYLVRRHRLAEACAWASCAALLALTMHWVRYNDAVATPEHAALTLASLSSSDLVQLDPRWVRLED